jgi:hypothetical protein
VVIVEEEEDTEVKIATALNVRTTPANMTLATQVATTVAEDTTIAVRTDTAAEAGAAGDTRSVAGTMTLAGVTMMAGQEEEGMMMDEVEDGTKKRGVEAEVEVDMRNVGMRIVAEGLGSCFVKIALVALLYSWNTSLFWI